MHASVPCAMMAALRLANEAQRQAALCRYDLMGEDSQGLFDSIVQAAAAALEAPIAMVTLIDGDRQLFRSAIGIADAETPRAISLCGHAIHEHDIMEVPDATQDPRFIDNPLVRGAPHIRFYAAARLATREMLALGTVCVIDRQPRRLSRLQRVVLAALAGAAMDLVEARRAAADAADCLLHSNRLLLAGHKWAGLGYWHIDAVTRSVFWSDEVYRVFDRAVAGGLPDLHDMICCFHADDRLDVNNFIESALSTGAEFSFDARILNRVGRITHVTVRGEAQFMPNGTITGLFGICQDVTRHKATWAA